MAAYTPEQVVLICTRKGVCLDTRAAAKRAARAKGRQWGKQFRVYQCPICSRFHLTARKGERHGR
jgi:hypothetical protein